jgi:hypothetical protein
MKMTSLTKTITTLKIFEEENVYKYDSEDDYVD